MRLNIVSKVCDKCRFSQPCARNALSQRRFDHMETSPKEQRGRPGQSASGVLPDLADRPPGRLPFRPVGAPMRCPAPTSPLPPPPPPRPPATPPQNPPPPPFS